MLPRGFSSSKQIRPHNITKQRKQKESLSLFLAAVDRCSTAIFKAPSLKYVKAATPHLDTATCRDTAIFPNEKFARRQALCWGTHTNLCGPPSKSQWTRIARHTHMLGSAPQLMWDPMSERPRLADAHEYMHGSSWRGTHPNFCGPPVFARWGMHPSLCGTPSLKARG